MNFNVALNFLIEFGRHNSLNSVYVKIAYLCLLVFITIQKHLFPSTLNVVTKVNKRVLYYLQFRNEYQKFPI